MAQNGVDEVPLPELPSDGLLILSLAPQHSRSAAHDLYPVCQPLAAQVVEGCSVATCHSVGDLTVLLDSPRWCKHKTVTALTVSNVSPKQRPQAALRNKHAAHQLSVWVSMPLAVAGAPREVDAWADVAVLTDLAPKLPDLQFLELFPKALLPIRTNAFGSSLHSALQYWPQLQHLHLASCNMGIKDVQRLFGAAACCQQLQTLDFTRNGLYLCDYDDMDGAGWSQSLQSAGQHWKQLRYLLLAHTELGPNGMSNLMTAAQQWEQLQVLDLSGNSIGAEGALALAAAATHWPRLQQLSLGACYLVSDRAQVLAAAVQFWPRLQQLDLAHTGIGSLGAQALSEAAPSMPELQHLNLGSNQLGVEAAQALAAAAPHWKKLRHLGLQGNELGDSGVRALAQAGQHWPELQHLDLGDNKFGVGGAQALAGAAPCWKKLKHLDLQGSGKIGDGGAK